MSYSNEQGYQPRSITAIITEFMTNINTQFGTAYTYETFVGTNFYKYFYALAQMVQENEVKTSETFLKLQDYIETTNDAIARPVVTPNGLIDILFDNNYEASVKPIIEADAGKVSVCVNVDNTDPNYAAIKLEICNILKDSVVAGVVTQGTETESLVLTNGQSFDFKFALPDITIPLLKLTLTLSENNQEVILSADEIKAKLLANIAAKYRLGKNFEPQRYFTVVDAPWAAVVKLEYSLDSGSTWLTTVYDADFDELFDCRLENITLVEL